MSCLDSIPILMLFRLIGAILEFEMNIVIDYEFK